MEFDGTARHGHGQKVRVPGDTHHPDAPERFLDLLDQLVFADLEIALGVLQRLVARKFAIDFDACAKNGVADVILCVGLPCLR